MHDLPDSSVVLGSGAGALTVAAELALLGLRVTVADFPNFSAGLEAVQEMGGVRVRCPWHGAQVAPIAETSTDPAVAVEGAPLVIVCVPSYGHELFAEALAPVLADEQVVIWVGEGGGSLAAAAALHRIGRRPGVLLGETNSLPYGTRVVAPATIGAEKKIGGTLVSALPGDAPVFEVASQIWPWVSRAENVWETVLTNFNAIDHVPPLLCNLGTIQGRTGKMLLWGEGATPGVARVIEAVDGEMLSLKKALEVSNSYRYVDYMVAQGLVDKKRDDLYSTLQASGLSNGTFLCGPEALQSRYMTEDVPFALVLASSIGHQIEVATPLIDGLIALASAATGIDWRAEGRTLAGWGLGEAGREELLRVAKEGWW
jgi:opine dehydrogenase